MDERSVATDQYVDFGTCGVENLSPYSSTSSFSEQPTYYQTEYEWQQQQQQSKQDFQIQEFKPQQAQQQTQQTINHQQPMLESERHLYTLYPAGGGEVTSHSYTYQQHPGTTDYYQPNGLWPATSTESIPNSQLAQSQRFFSNIDLQQPRPHSSSSTASSQSGKPKRKRVQSHTQRKAANVRERRRMFHLNEAFDELRKRLPAFNYEKRLSRIETLRLAMTYISFMKDVSVGNDPKVVKLKPHGSELSHDEMSISPRPALLVNHTSFSAHSDMGDKIMSDDESECSDNEHSNHSG